MPSACHRRRHFPPGTGSYRSALLLGHHKLDATLTFHRHHCWTRLVPSHNASWISPSFSVPCIWWKKIKRDYSCFTVMSFTTWCHKTCLKKACILLNKTCDMIQNYHFIIEQYYEFILLHEWHLLIPWQGLGTDNAMLDPMSPCLAICWHSLSNYCHRFTWRKKPKKTMSDFKITN